ncbi:hypothetical protein B0H15DRAFT_822510 [Mycena belliarum]|uniref:Transmembrane protein n=1 Tax=Mycena belliarum TaxID=1033014 RepID=A0AAD6UAW4_9AGAR|nr:hypothetical protein B0H15DRAFT_822510 [Mycena belliae]
MKDLIIVASLAHLLLHVVAQTSNVTTCIPLYQWSLNSRLQTPCLVGAFLESVCEGPVEVNTLPEGNHYIGPSSSDATLCRCSTVTYSLISACAGCQNRTFRPWTEWAAACTQVEVGQFLQTIPAQVVVPSWAYLDVTKTDNIFNPILANQSLSQPPSSTSASTLAASSGTPLSSTPLTLPSTSTATHKNPNAGAIAGGVVGGLVFLVLVVLATLLFLRHRRRSSEEAGFTTRSSISTSPTQMQEGGRRSAQTITPFPYKEPFAKERSEGATLPGSPVMSAVHTTYDSPSVAPPALEVLHRYTGSAEV